MLREQGYLAKIIGLILYRDTILEQPASFVVCLDMEFDFIYKRFAFRKLPSLMPRVELPQELQESIVHAFVGLTMTPAKRRT
jgi:hypothetical protein